MSVHWKHINTILIHAYLCITHTTHVHTRIYQFENSVTFMGIHQTGEHNSQKLNEPSISV